MATFFNQATLTYSGGTVNSNITSGEILEVLSITKTAVAEEYSNGSDITYAVNIVNSGNTAFSSLTLTDDLGSYEFDGNTLLPLSYNEGSIRYFSNGVLQAAPAVTAGPPLTISGITVPANGNVTLLYTARTTSFASPETEGTIENTATLSGGGITPISASETVAAANEPMLGISKSLSPETVTENGQITYTFTVQNIGNTAAAATDDIVITDTFNPILSDITVTYNGAVLTEGTDYTYDEATGLFSTVSGVITVPAATFVQNPATGEWTVDPGNAVITVTGTV